MRQVWQTEPRVGDAVPRIAAEGFNFNVGGEELPESSREHHVMLNLLDRGDGAALEALTIKHLGHVIGWWAGNPKTVESGLTFRTSRTGYLVDCAGCV